MTVVAVDSHAHIFDIGREFDSERTYTPDPSQFGTAERFLSVLDFHGISHGLVVAAEPYGFDNSAMLGGISRSNGRLKGIALVRPDIHEHELDRLADAGVIGIRYNLTSFGRRQFDDPATPSLLDKLAERGWFLQIHCEKDELVDVLPMLRTCRSRLMIDHFARPEVSLGIEQPGFQALLELGRTGNAIVKLSGAFRVSETMPPYEDVEPFISAAVEAFGLENCVWGSDWPFVKVTQRIDYGPELDCVKRWFPNEADRRKVLAENPARLFGFA